MYYEDEIDQLEYALSNLESAITAVEDTPYHGHLAMGWELDKEEIQARLEELYTLQEEQWRKENAEQNLIYERSV